MLSSLEYYFNNPEVILALKEQRKLFGNKNLLNVSIPPARLDTFLKQCVPLREMEQLVRSFNLYEAIGVHEREIKHSRVIAWLLDPRGSHMQDHRYLESFFGLVKISKTAANWNWSDFIVQPENQRIDVLVVNHRAKVLCAIENKVHASQSVGQLERYRKYLEQTYPDYQRHYVFLTLQQEKPDDSTWQVCSLSKFVSKINSEGTVPNDKSALSFLYGQYADWIEAQGNPPQDNLFQILNLARHELRHSDFLRWLLSPSESHQLNDLFLRFFLELIAQKSLSPLPIHSHTIDWTDVEVRREFENIDLLILNERHQIAIVVENKIYAQERFGQIEEYEQFVQRHFGYDHLVLVFLDVLGRKSTHNKTVNLAYLDLLPFFTANLASDSLSRDEAAACLLEQYRKLLSNKLWIRRKTLQYAPPSLHQRAIQVWHNHRSEVMALLQNVEESQNQVSENLGTYLLDEAKILFSSEIARRDMRVYFSFVPVEYDDLPLLRSSGADGAFKGRLLMYQFYITPFGDAVSVRPSQVSIDIKMLKVQPEFASLKQFLHDRAKSSEIFNRVNGTKPGNFDSLLNHQLVGLDELARFSADDLNNVLKRRLLRFHQTIHQEVVTFFRKQIAEFEP